MEIALQARFWLYYGLCSIGLIGVIRSHIRFIYGLLFKEDNIQLYDFIGRWTDKPIELFFFFFGAIISLMYTLLIYTCWQRIRSDRAIQKIWRRSGPEMMELAWGFLLALLNVLTGFGFWASWFGNLGIWLGDLLWLAMAIFPILGTRWFRRYRRPWSENWPKTFSGLKKIYALFILVAFLQMVSIIWPFIAKSLNMMTEYLEIPTKTLVGEHYVDTADYFSAHQLLGAQPRYQILPNRTANVQLHLNSAACLSIPLNPGVERLLQETRNRAAYFYDRESQMLCNTGVISPEDWLLIRQAAVDPELLLRAESWMGQDIERASTWRKRIFTVEENAFFVTNNFELEFLFNGIWVLHHHNFVLGPINEYALGKLQQDIFPQYGWLNMVVTTRLLEWFGGITYDRYFRVWYSYFIIYFVLLIGLFWCIFRHWGYMAFATVLSVGLMSCIPFHWYFQGPGLNPVRHFFDIFVLAGFYFYVVKKQAVYLYMTLVAGIVGILNNPQLGLACFGALVAATSIVWFRKAIKPDKLAIILVGAATVLACYCGLCHPFWSDGPFNAHYLMGISSQPSMATRVILILVVCGLADVLLCWHIMKNNDYFAYIAVLFVLYSQGVLLYSLWGSTATHYLSLATIYVTALTMILKLLLDYSGLSVRRRELGIFCLFVCSLAVLVVGARVHEYSRQVFETNFRQHELFEWNLKRAHFVSTMNPQSFSQSADLIRRYSPEPAIYIISQFDAILPFLAEKYSAMPFFELSKFFASPRDLQLTIELIHKKQPAWLFVDTDIKRDFAVDVVDPRAMRDPYAKPLYSLSVQRVRRLELLQEVFLAVQTDYELVEQGPLISAYKRKVNANSQ